MKEILILRVVVGWEVQIEDKKVKVVKEWKIPTKIKEVESFLRFVDFYRYFIKNFSYSTKYFNELKNKQKWK